MRRPGFGRLRSLAAAACTGAGVALFAPVHAAEVDEVRNFGDNPGNLEMFVHLPANTQPGLPLVVALHGCEQSATDFDGKTGLADLAGDTPFVLVLPQQSTDNHPFRCFRWYDRDDNRPGQGESASILAMVDHAIDAHDADPDRVFVFGLSAGGGITAVLLANYPDRFAGGAIVAGVPFDCDQPFGPFDIAWYLMSLNPVDGARAGYACGVGGYFSTTDRDAAEWGSFVRAAAESTPATWPRVSIWQGAKDNMVDPDNREELVEQWTDVHGIDAIPDGPPVSVGRGTRLQYKDANGDVRVEAWSIEGFKHAFPIDTDGDPAACGVPAPYINDADLCAVRQIAKFWGLGSPP